jgi:hypothetical protein
MAPETLLQRPGNGCEEKCVFFKALPDSDQGFNRAAKHAAEYGREFPGSAGSMCGGCVSLEKIRQALEERQATTLGHS